MYTFKLKVWAKCRIVESNSLLIFKHYHTLFPQGVLIHTSTTVIFLTGSAG